MKRLNSYYRLLICNDLRLCASAPLENISMTRSRNNQIRALSFACLFLFLNLFHVGFSHFAQPHQHECWEAGSKTVHAHGVFLDGEHGHYHSHHHYHHKSASDSQPDQENESCCVVDCCDQSSMDATTILNAPHLVAIAASADSRHFAPAPIPLDEFADTNSFVWPNAPPDRQLGRAPPCSTGFCSFRRANI